MNGSQGKDFDGWNKTKKRLHGLQGSIYPKQREVWWCSLGVNIGNEVDGKNDNFERPVIVIKAYGTKTIWGVPVTTQAKNKNEFYFSYAMREKSFIASLTDMRSLSNNRLRRKIGRITKTDFKKLCERIAAFL